MIIIASPLHPPTLQDHGVQVQEEPAETQVEQGIQTSKKDKKDEGGQVNNTGELGEVTL